MASHQWYTDQPCIHGRQSSLPHAFAHLMACAAAQPTFVFIKDGQKSKFSGADPQQLVKVLDELK